MQIGILGNGKVAHALGEGWKRAGHDVIYSSRTPEGDVVSFNAATTRPIVVLATPFSSAEALLRSLDFTDRILIDTTNPIRPDFSGLSVHGDESAGEWVEAWARPARVVKAFNSIGFNVMSDPAFGDERAALLYAGNDADAKAVVHQLAVDLGFDPVDAGPISQSRSLEAFAWLWITLAMKAGHGRDIAFRFLTR